MNDGQRAFEWGLASMFVGGVTSYGAMLSNNGPPFLLTNVLVDVPGITLAVLVVPAMMQVIAFVGAAFGVRAMMLARRSHRPVAFGLAGLLLGVAALFNWAISGATWYLVLAE